MLSILRRHIRHQKINLTLIAQRSDSKETELKAILFGIHDEYRGVKVRLSNDTQLKEYGDLLRLFLDGKIHSLEKIPVSFDGFTDFRKKVLEAARSIRWGSTVSYKELASMSGIPRSVRAIASVMRNNPFPLVIPCHRVIKSDGTIGGFAGKRNGGMVVLKKMLLEQESEC